MNCSCEYQCDPAKCQTCVDGSCQVCGGDTSKICCDDGSCVDECSLGSENDDCTWSLLKHLSCSGECFGTSQSECQVDVYRLYKGGGSNSCNGGCPGECTSVVKVCYIDYPCISVSSPLGLCISNSYCELWFLNQCYFCTADMESGVPVPAPYWKCSAP